MALAETGQLRGLCRDLPVRLLIVLHVNGLVWETGQALLRSPRGRNASRDGLVKLGWVRCLQYTLNCFQYNVCGLCRCEPSNHQVTLHNVI